MPALAYAQGALEKKDVHLAVGGKAALYYLPLTVAEQLGYFKQEGLDVKISDFAGGAQSLRAVVGGSADAVAGAYEHTINMQAQKQALIAFVQMGRVPQISVGISTAKAAGYKSPKDLKGLKIGVSAPGSSTNILFNYFISRDGLKPNDVAIIGVGTGAGGIAAMKSGQIDAISNTDPMMTKLEQDGAIKIIADWRTVKGTEQTFGGQLPAASLYAPTKYVKRKPEYRAGVDERDRPGEQVARERQQHRRAESRPRGVSARRPGALPLRLRQGEGSVLEGRDDLRSGSEGDAEGARRLQPEDQLGRDQPGRDLHQRVREEGERQVQVSGAAPALALANITCTFVAREDRSQRYTAVRDVTLHRRRRRIRIGRRADRVRQVDASQRCRRAARALGRIGDRAWANRSSASIGGQGIYSRRKGSCRGGTRSATSIAGLEFRGVSRHEAAERGGTGCGASGLGGFGDRYPHQLSGGMRRRVSLAQMLILNPQILLMDEPFSALDVQTRQLMENELLELWSADRKSVVFITHDLEEAISLSDRVVVLSAGPETRPIGQFVIDLPRPRDVSEIRLTPRFIELHSQIWRAMKEEVLKGYAQQQRQG